MDYKTINLLNKILKLLSHKTYSDHVPSIYFEKVDKNKVEEYILREILNNFSKEELLSLKYKIFYIGNNYNFAGILIKDNEINKVIIPKLDSVLSSIIICHELMHYVIYKNKKDSLRYMSLYDELIPINQEFVFLNEFYKDYIYEHYDYRFNEMIKRANEICSYSKNNKIQSINPSYNTNEIINALSHIYSLLILIQNSDYGKNNELFKKIIISPNPLEYELKDNGIYLNKTIIKTLKNMN